MGGYIREKRGRTRAVNSATINDTMQTAASSAGHPRNSGGPEEGQTHGYTSPCILVALHTLAPCFLAHKGDSKSWKCRE